MTSKTSEMMNLKEQQKKRKKKNVGEGGGGSNQLVNVYAHNKHQSSRLLDCWKSLFIWTDPCPP